MNTRTYAHIQHDLRHRAEALAVAERWPGPGKFATKHYRLALAELSPEERLVERRLDHEEPSLRQRASAHQDQVAALLLKRGTCKTFSGAKKAADAMVPVLAKLAGPRLPHTRHAVEGGKATADAANHYALLTGARRYQADPNTGLSLVASGGPGEPGPLQWCIFDGEQKLECFRTKAEAAGKLAEIVRARNANRGVTP